MIHLWPVLGALLTSSPAPGASKALIAEMHGENLAVEYQVLNSGAHVLVTKNMKPASGEPSVQLQVVELKLKTGEALAATYGFRCTRNGADSVYAVVAKRTARERGSFPPERAWEVDQKNLRLNPIADVKSISCIWSPEGEGKYSFR